MLSHNAEQESIGLPLVRYLKPEHIYIRYPLETKEGVLDRLSMVVIGLFGDPETPNLSLRGPVRIETTSSPASIPEKPASFRL